MWKKLTFCLLPCWSLFRPKSCRTSNPTPHVHGSERVTSSAERKADPAGSCDSPTLRLQPSENHTEAGPLLFTPSIPVMTVRSVQAGEVQAIPRPSELPDQGPDLTCAPPDSHQLIDSGRWMRSKESAKELEAERIMLTQRKDSGVGSLKPESTFVSAGFSTSRYCDSMSGMSFIFNQASTATVQLERLVLLSNHILGFVTVTNLGSHKEVYVHWTSDGWQTFTDTPCKYLSSNVPSQRDTFGFQLSITSRVELCICYTVQAQTFCDNNSGENYSLL